MTPGSIEELTKYMRAQHEQRRGGEVSLQALNRLIEYNPEDLTVTVEAGISFEQLQLTLREHKQWLPLDPPGQGLTLRDIISRDLSGPRRMGYGTIRDYLIGLTVVLADGRVASSGGRVVKNVAGYDMMKLFVGAQDSLGIPVQATFKLLPLPEVERFHLAREAALQAIWRSQTSPVVLDLFRESGEIFLATGFAGTAEDVAWQEKQLENLGLEPLPELTYARSQASSFISVPPSQVLEKAGIFKKFIVRAGNGVIYTEEATPSPISAGVAKLNERLKQTFDPHGILPKLNL